MRRCKSTLINGAGDDARALSAHLASYLDIPPVAALFGRDRPESGLVMLAVSLVDATLSGPMWNDFGNS